MKFQINNLGRLKQANIDMNKGLIIFCGKNNTSKTYAAHAIYGLCEHYFIVMYNLILRKYVQIDASSRPIQIDLEEIIRKSMRDILEDLSSEYTKELPDIFATDENFVGTATVRIEISDEEIEGAVRELRLEAFPVDGIRFGDNQLSMKKDENSGMVSFLKVPSPGDLLSKSEESVSSLKSENDELVDGVFAGLTLLICRLIFDDFGMTAHVLSAERSAIQLFSHELSLRRNELVEQMLKLQSHRRRFQKNKESDAIGPDTKDPMDILQRRARRYPLPIQESLKIADDLINLSKTKTNFANLADWAEANMLQGTIQINKDGEMRFHPNESDKYLEMHLASSSVKALSSLVFYLRHLLNEGCLAIIDEPELNLHPDNQRLVARLIVRMVNAGIKVLISTHSEYIIREFNNLIMLNMDTDGEKRTQFGYEREDILDKEQVGAYLFTGTTATQIDVTTTGIEVKSIDEELNKLNTISQELYYSFFSPKATESL